MSQKSIGRRELFKQAAAVSVAGALGAQAAPRVAMAQEMADKVPRKILGSTGAEVPILLMGGEVAFNQKFDRLLHRAFKDGIDYIDSAETYTNGKSQQAIGVFAEQVGRENLWITTKAGLWANPGVAPPERFMNALEESLHAMKIDQADMFLMHGVENPDFISDAYVKMGAEMKKKGHTKFFGFSCHDGTVVELMNKAAAIGSAGIDAVMFKYSFAEYGDADLNKAIDACKAAGIGLIAMKAQDSVPQDAEAVKTFQSNNFTLGQAKLKAVWADDRIDTCVSGILNTKHLKENADAAKSSVQLTMGEFIQLNRYAAWTADYRCKFCNHICESKVEGNLRIADQLRFLMYDESYGLPEVARQRYNELRPDQRDFEGVDLGPAMAACPRNINIAKRLEEARRRFA